MNGKSRIPSALSMVVLSFLSSTSCSPAAQPPNLLLIVVDTLRADHLGSYAGVGGTPNLDAFAQESVVFRNALSTAPNTINSAPSILTSTYPSEHRYTNYRVAVSPDHETLAEVLAAAGYETFAVSTNPHVTRRNGLAQGFDSFLDHPTWTDTDARAVNGLFLQWLDARTSAQPFFAMLWYVDPHTPYEPPAELLYELLDEHQRTLVSERTIRPGSNNLSDEEKDVARLLYRGEVMSFDREFGALMQHLRQRRLLDGTLVVFTADHGESFWENTDVDGRPLVGHGVSLFRTEIAVPLMMRFPAPARPRAVESRVSTVDIVPTVLSAMGVRAAGAPFRGRNLMSLVRGESPNRGAPAAVSELYTDFNGTVNFHLEGITTDAGKLVLTHRYRGRELTPASARFFDAMDRPLDPAPQRLESLRAELLHSLDAWRETLAPMPTLAVGEIEREDELIERLRALGYLR